LKRRPDRLNCAQDWRARQAAPPPKTFDLNLRSESTLLATAITAVVTDPKAFQSGRDSRPGSGFLNDETRLAANRSLGRSKQGARYLRCILVLGAHAVLKCARCNQRSIPGSHSFSRRPTFRFESCFENRGTPDQDAVFLIRASDATMAELRY
jgi:hypothetical protein